MRPPPPLRDCLAGFIHIPALDDKRFPGHFQIIRPLCGLSAASALDGVIVPPEKDDIMAFMTSFGCYLALFSRRIHKVYSALIHNDYTKKPTLYQPYPWLRLSPVIEEHPLTPECRGKSRDALTGHPIGEIMASQADESILTDGRSVWASFARSSSTRDDSTEGIYENAML